METHHLQQWWGILCPYPPLYSLEKLIEWKLAAWSGNQADKELSTR
jgi:hypothetical protein